MQIDFSPILNAFTVKISALVLCTTAASGCDSSRLTQETGSQAKYYRAQYTFSYEWPTTAAHPFQVWAASGSR